MRRPGVALVAILFLGAPACRKAPLVKVDQLYTAEAGEGEQVRQVTPPFCQQLPETRYPEEVAPNERPERVAIRVDFLLDEWGRADRLEASVLSDVDGAEPFVAAALAAAGSIRCIPAMRPPLESVGEKVPMTIAYRTALLFTFVRDERTVSVDLEGQAAP